jgi:phosphoadenosine phosphosulfate reductase
VREVSKYGNKMPDDEYEYFLLYSHLNKFVNKLMRTEKFIQNMLKKYNPYVAFSGGKDSWVVLHIILKYRPDIPIMFANSGNEYPDTLNFINYVTDKYNLNLYEIEVSESMTDIYNKVGAYQFKSTDETWANLEPKRVLIYEPADEMKKMGYDSVIMGLRSDESKGRAYNTKKNGAEYFCKYDDIIHLNPMAYWNIDDIWAYIVQCGIPYNKIYDKPWKNGRKDIRVATYAGRTSITEGRWLFLKLFYPEMWNEFVKKFPMAGGFV